MLPPNNIKRYEFKTTIELISKINYLFEISRTKNINIEAYVNGKLKLKLYSLCE